jgi:membrane associated rhomboid family serine protease
MGLENRDYARGSSGWSGGYGGFGGSGSSLAPVCKWLIIINVAVFVLQLMTAREATVEHWLSLDPERVVFHGEVWRLLTYAFCHARQELLHILFNMLFLWWFGRTLESMYGSREFLLFYLAGAVLSGAVFVGLGLAMRNLTPAIGASGAVMAVMMLYAMHFPRQQILLFMVLPVEIRWVVAAYVLFDLYPVLIELGGGQAGDGIAHTAHLGGLAFGFAYGKFRWRIERLFGGWRLPKLGRMFGPRRRIRLHKPSTEATARTAEVPEPYEPREPFESRAALEARVDAILEKISEHGEASLTDDERETLKKASRLYRRR